MKKITPLFIALILFSSQNIFAGSPEPKDTKKAEFQFTAFGVTQNSWDYALLHYNINDLATGETLEIPSFLINYEVKDKTGSTVASGSGLYVKIQDTKLGSEEDYTIIVSTMINGEKICQTLSKKASPKKFAMKVDANGANPANGALANDISVTCSRPKYSNPNESENIQLNPSDVSVAVVLDNCTNCGTYKIDAGANHPKLADQADYKNLEKQVAMLTRDGQNVQMTINPTITFKGEVYKDSQSSYDVTASSVSEIPTLEAVATR